MSDILGSIIYDENLHLLGRAALSPPCSHEETRILTILQSLDRHTAWNLQDAITILVEERHVEAFRSGIRFGVRLAGELAEDTPEDY